MKKFELTTETKINIFGKKLFRIKALISFGPISAGEKGGWVEKEENLSQSGNAWVFGNAEVYDNAWVHNNACVHNNAWVSGNAEVSGNAYVSGNAEVRRKKQEKRRINNMCIEKLIELLPNSVKCDTVDFKDVRLMDGRSAIRVTIDRLLTQEEKDKMTSKRFVGLDCVGFYKYAPEIKKSYFYVV